MPKKKFQTKFIKEKSLDGNNINSSAPGVNTMSDADYDYDDGNNSLINFELEYKNFSDDEVKEEENENFV